MYSGLERLGDRVMFSVKSSTDMYGATGRRDEGVLQREGSTVYHVLDGGQHLDDQV